MTVGPPLVRPPDTPPGATSTSRRWFGTRGAKAIASALAVTVVTAAVVLVVGRDGGSAVPRVPVFGQAKDVYDGDLGDPFVLPVPGGDYVAFGTGDWPARVPTAHSADLDTWHAGPDAMPDLPAWASPDPKNSLSWAPAVLAPGHGYVLYISLREERTSRECIAATSSATPAGPYHDAIGKPLVCQYDLGGSIDPSIVRDQAGRSHLLWKSDGNCCNLPTSVWEQALAPDGLGLVGQPHRLLDAAQPWQGGVIEEPAMVRAGDGGWWLFYSGNRFDSADYATGLAYCQRLEGPCRDTSQRPFPLVTSPGQHSPGGLEVFRGTDGSLWAVYDTWNRPSRNGRFYCCRSVQMAPIRSL
jgi:beta-xylosidase